MNTGIVDELREMAYKLTDSLKLAGHSSQTNFIQVGAREIGSLLQNVVEKAHHVHI